MSRFATRPAHSRPPPPECTDYTRTVASSRCGANCTAPTYDSEVLSRLPVLSERGQSPAWDTYLQRVYGDADPPTYPIDLKRLSWLYYDSLPIRVVPAQRHPYCLALYGHAWISPLDCSFPTSRIGAFGAFIQHYDPTRGALRGPTHLHGAHRRMPVGVESHAWVEIARTSTNHPLERCSFWYFHAPGSGIWWNVGKTYVANVTEDEDHWFPTPLHVAQRQGLLPCRGSEALRRLIRDGYHSLQLPDLARMYPNNHYEIVDLRHWSLKGGNISQCARSHGEYRSGFSAQQPCSCHFIQPSQTHRVPVSIIGCRESRVRNCGPPDVYSAL